MTPFLRTAYNYDMNEAGDETGLDCSVEPSMTKQSFAEEADINTIVRRFGLTGQLPENVRMPTYEDFTGVTDFKSAMDALALARESFEEMPAHVRERFDNDPHQFVEFCSDEKNRDEAVKLGLVPAKKLEEVAQAAQAAGSTPAVPPVAAPVVAAPAASAQ